MEGGKKVSKERKPSSGQDKERETWGGRLEFILSCLGFAVGLGNVWRYPHLAGSYGGSAFMMAYLVLICMVGLPMFYMEMSIGQFGQMAPAVAWTKITPLFSGLGWATILVPFYTCYTYNMIIALAIYYMFASMQSPLPWQGCGNKWNTDRCYDDIANDTCNDMNMTYYKQVCYNDTTPVFRQIVKHYYKEEGVSAAKEFFDRRVMRESKRIEDIGTPSLELVICLLTSWALVFVCLIKGIKSSGKVVYFTATFPYIILIIFIIRGYTLEGSSLGFYYFMVPNFKPLAEPKVWSMAITQVFFSLSLGGGGMTTLASYNKFENNIFRDTLIVVFGDWLTSLLGCNAIFSLLGHVAYKKGVEVSDISASGFGLAFEAYPQVVNRLTPSVLWAVLFFFMLIILGIDSAMVLIHTVITAIGDAWPSVRHGNKRRLVLLGVCGLEFVLGICLTCNGGSYIMNIIDNYAGGWPAVMIAFIEICILVYVYGLKRFICDLHMMLGKPPARCYVFLGYPTNWYWYITWLIITPITLFVLIISEFIKYKPSERGTENQPGYYKFPVWADVIGWCLTLALILVFIGFTVFNIIWAKIKGRSVRRLLAPIEPWPDSTGTEVTLPKFFDKIGVCTMACVQEEVRREKGEPPDGWRPDSTGSHKTASGRGKPTTVSGP